MRADRSREWRKESRGITTDCEVLLPGFVAGFHGSLVGGPHAVHAIDTERCESRDGDPEWESETRGQSGISLLVRGRAGSPVEDVCDTESCLRGHIVAVCGDEPERVSH